MCWLLKFGSYRVFEVGFKHLLVTENRSPCVSQVSVQHLLETTVVRVDVRASMAEVHRLLRALALRAVFVVDAERSVRPASGCARGVEGGFRVVRASCDAERSVRRATEPGQRPRTP